MAQPVKLKYIDEFRKELAHYHVSESAQWVLDMSKLVVMSGLAGGGRNTIINKLVEHHNYFFLVSDTTRPPKLRSGVMEQNGNHYYFRTEEDMLRDIRNGEFIEAEIIHNQQVSGTSIRELERANVTGKIAIHDFEYGGAHNVAVAKPDAFIIGLVPPSYDIWIQRLQNREEMHAEEFLNRLATADKVLKNMVEQPYFKFVMNDNLNQCVDDLREIVEFAKVDSQKQLHCRLVIGQILERVQKKLAKSL